MPDSEIDPYDIGALERSVNDSATRVSAIWLSFVAFSAYLAAAASNVSHRQLFLEDPIKLPTINIDLPLVASAILLPLLFVIYHVFLLLQVVLLARTADAYNEALEHGVSEAADRTLVRQRLANTLFAQLFAGSPREREGLLGWLLRLMAWVTLAIAPVLVLLVFEIKFLPYHSPVVTWTHRGLIALDLLAVLLLWAAAVRPRNDMTWRAPQHHWETAAGAAVVVALCCVFVTFPGEPARTLVRHLSFVQLASNDYPDCWAPKFIAALFSDSLSLQGEDFVDEDKLDKIKKIAEANGQTPSDSERTRSFRGRDLRCGNFAGADLRRAEFTGADLSGSSLKGAHLEGATFSSARLRQAVLNGAQLQGAFFAEKVGLDAPLKAADLQGASLIEAQLQGALLSKAKLQNASFEKARLPGAELDQAELQGASFHGARLQGASLDGASLLGVDLLVADVRGAWFVDARLHSALLGSTDFRGANFERAMLQGARFNSSQLTLANFADAFLWRTTGARCDDAQVVAPDFDAFLEIGTFVVPGTRRRNTETRRIKPEPAELDGFIGRSTQGMPAGRAEYLGRTLKERLAIQTPDAVGEESETIWTACAAKAVDKAEYQQRHAAFLANLICEPNADSKYTAEGLYRHRWGWLRGVNARTFARHLLGLDGTSCPGAKDLDENIKVELRDMASQPSN
jgi:uncharacterized protein YjbI with pentapeptide repeats